MCKIFSRRCYLNATSALFAHEPATTAWLAGAAPGVVPGLLAIDEARACVLMYALPPAQPALTVEQQRVSTCAAIAQVQVAAAGPGRAPRDRGAESGLASSGRALADMLPTGITAGQLDGRRHRRHRARLP